jgi:hypothetical protein
VTGKAAVQALLEVLAEERKAIRTLDGAAVEQAATKKEELVGELREMTATELLEEARNLALLRAELRRNSILLAHARACLKEATDVRRNAEPSRRVSSRL